MSANGRRTAEGKEHQRQRAEEALRTAQTELARVTRVTSMGELAASIAHEVTQPLTGIVTNGNACLHWLESTPPNVEKARTTVERIIRDSDRASEVIGDIRTLVKKARPHQEPVDVNDLIRRTITLARGEMTRHQVGLRIALAACLPDVVGDRVQLQQVLLNLIINATEAMSTVTGRARILTIRSERREVPETLCHQRKGFRRRASIHGRQSVCSTRSLRPSRKGWAWAFRFAGLLSQRTGGFYRMRTTRTTGRPSSLYFRHTKTSRYVSE